MKSSKKDQIREVAQSGLIPFIQLIHPRRVLGGVHHELITWMTRSARKSHQLVLLPRDHQKSAIAAYDTVWRVTCNPAIRILYISSTANLATKQLGFIKEILTSDIYRFYWPEMIHPEEGKREKWTESEISVDHPLRRIEAIRDPTIFTAGLTTSITGLHCDHSCMDDVVVKENAYTSEGREKTKQQYSLLSSVESTNASSLVVGTRYHPKDLYNDMQGMVVDTYDEDGNEADGEPLYEIFERQVEDRGDGTGQFIWPLQQRTDGKWFGFNDKILAKKRAQYLDKVQYRAQYYNDPNDYESGGIDRSQFQYYNKSYLSRSDDKWYYKTNRLNIFAAVDFAFSLSHRADYTAIVVIGVDGNQQYYVLDIDRFRSNNVPDYFKRILALHQKWDIRKIWAETTAAQQVIVDDIRHNYIRTHGLSLSIEDFRPTRYQGSKEERIQAALQARYQNKQIWHYQGGNCQILEDELILQNPAHDDVKDCLATVVSKAIAPTGTVMRLRGNLRSQEYSNAKFGGIA